MRKTLLALVMTLLAAGASHAQWKVVGNSAVAENKDGHSLSVYRHANGWVWASFALSDRTPDLLAANKAPTYKVDQNTAHDVGDAMRIQGAGIPVYKGEPKRVSFAIWRGDDPDIRNAKIDQLMTGRDVVVNYTVANGMSKQTTFALNGAGQAIAKALDIEKKADRKLAEYEETFRWAYREVMKKCRRDGVDATECSDRAIACGAKAGSMDLAVFQACVK